MNEVVGFIVAFAIAIGYAVAIIAMFIVAAIGSMHVYFTYEALKRRQWRDLPLTILLACILLAFSTFVLHSLFIGLQEIVVKWGTDVYAMQ